MPSYVFWLLPSTETKLRYEYNLLIVGNLVPRALPFFISAPDMKVRRPGNEVEEWQV